MMRSFSSLRSLAAFFLRERWNAAFWAALLVLLAGLTIGIAVRSAGLDGQY
jgi:hypothetical protein